jgi:hypothetical protein
MTLIFQLKNKTKQKIHTKKFLLIEAVLLEHGCHHVPF